MYAGPHSAGSSMMPSAWGRVWMICSGRVIRSQKRVTGRNASLTVVEGLPKSSIC